MLGRAQTVVEAALAAARATAEAEEAAACATRLSEAADHYEREAEAEQKEKAEGEGEPDPGVPPGVHPGSRAGQCRMLEYDIAGDSNHVPAVAARSVLLVSWWLDRWFLLHCRPCWLHAWVTVLCLAEHLCLRV